MKKDSLVYALGQVDDQYIMESAPNVVNKTRKYSLKWGTIAACLMLAVILGASVAVAAGILNPLFSYFQDHFNSPSHHSNVCNF